MCKCESVRMCDSLLLLGKMKRSVWPAAQREEVKTSGRGEGGHILMKAGVKEIQWRTDQV